MTETPARIIFTDTDTGCHLDGHMGWHNTYRAVQMALSHGFAITDEERAALESFIENGHSCPEDEWEMVNGQGGLSDRATDFLASITAPGLMWEWDMGELSLVPACQTESEPAKPADCEHCIRTQFA